jgi:cell division protein FtsQ
LLFSNFFWFFAAILAVSCVCYLNLEKITKKKVDRFLIKEIEFDGNEKVSDILLLKASGIRYKTNIFSYDLSNIKNKLEHVSWIKYVIVQRKLPHKIYIRIAERVPIAILQSKYKLYLIDSNGVVLDHDGIGNFPKLPIVIGKGAEEETAKLLQYLDKFQKIKNQLVFAVRIGKRRWNMKINKGITVKLPEKGLMQALGILDEISDANGFFNDNIVSLDLRMLDRIVVTKKPEQPTENIK